MRRIAVFLVIACLAIATHVDVYAQATFKKSPPKEGGQIAPKVNSKTTEKSAPANELAADRPVATEKQSSDEIAIRLTGDTYLKAFNEGDAKSIGEHYTSDAEYIDERGHLLQGRTAIEDSLKAYFAKNPGRKLAMSINSIRIVSPGLAMEDGIASVTDSTNADPNVARYTAVHVKQAGKWLVASVRDTAIKPQRQHRIKLRELDWMLGEWVHEGNDAVVVFTCEPIDGGNFLIRNFTIKIAGQEPMGGSQRIGWDAQAGKFRAWIFDSDGGHSDGYWHRDGDSWVLKSTGVTSDGQTASSTTVYSFVNAHTMTFQSLDHEVAGVEYPDSAKVKIVRHPPRPE